VAGMRVRCSAKDSGSLEIQIGNEPLIADKMYCIASTDWEFSEMVNYLVIPDEQIEYELPTIMPEVLEDYIRKNTPMQISSANRITCRLP
jgi:hypothetical protein